VDGRNQVSGTLAKSGKPLEFDPMFGRVEMYFVPMKGSTRPSPSTLPDETEAGGGQPVPPGVGEGGKSEYVEVFPAQVFPGGEFKVDGGIPDGRYLVTVRQFPRGKQFGAPLNQQDSLKGEFSIHKSPIVRDIKGSMTLEIDLAKPKG
jgi:hypothetical protein